MTEAERIHHAEQLMQQFAERTGIGSAHASRRYLWTDAFAVCNYLGLARATGAERHSELARRLVDQVHHVLGRHRPDDARRGWISGLPARDGEAHPTRGGLRIGKPLAERAAGEPFDERREWDRDGQYFHYLTKWMYALDLAARATGEREVDGNLARWSRELAVAAHRAFTYAPRPGARKRMYWKMSIDLSRPQVASMGHHDPLDGLITAVQLAATAARQKATDGPSLEPAIADFAAMIEPRQLATDDPLGLGGLLVDAGRVAQLMTQRGWPDGDDLLVALLGAALVGLRSFTEHPHLRAPAERRLGFRELGLAIGLASVSAMIADPRFAGGADAGLLLEQLARHVPIRDAIEAFWLDPAHRLASSWRDHADINDVMLATSLVPAGFLVLPP